MAEASATSVATSNQEQESLEIIDLDELDLEFQDDETWLVSPTPELEKSPDQAISPSWRKWNMSDDPEVRMKKKSLVEKLDFIAKGSPTRGFYASRPSMSSTPIIQNKTSTQTISSPSKFDPRTFTRPLKNNSLRNLTFDKETTDMLANLSIDTKAIQGSDTDDTWKNSTFTRKMSRISRDSSEALDDDRVSLASSDASSSHRLNDVGDVQNLARLQEESLRQSQGLNSTFNKDVNSTFTKAGRGLNSTYQKSPPSNTDLGIGLGGLNHHTSHNNTFEVIRDIGTTGNQTFSTGNGSNGTTGSGNGSNQGIKTATSKDSRSSSQDIDLEDRLSSTSDSSMSHRLNDLGDVQHLARMQEESLRQAVMSNNHRSATVSPSSENSPSTEGCGMMPNDLQSEEGSYAGSHAHNHRNSGGGVGGGYAQYSSQDSLPDSPYSSQSLDSQPATGQDRIARSMPNLNKIRGQKKNSAGPPAGSKTGLGRGQHNYGLSSRHHNSDPRMVPGHPGSRQVQTGYNQQQNQGVPSRGTVLSRDSSTGSSSGIRQPMRYQSGIRPPSTATSRIARPSTTGIPRPGASRLPAPTSSGIPKPNSNPGSRAPSASGSRKSSYCY